jgi:kynureninase
MHYDTSSDFAQDCDRHDPLSAFRAQFHIPLYQGQPSTYLCGHSLGLQPRRVAADLMAELDTWQQLAVAGHFAGERPWMHYHTLFRAPFAHLTGAAPEEVVAMNSLTANLHLMLTSFYRPSAARYKILIEAQAFPSDRYAVASQIALHGLDPAACLVEVGPLPGSAVTDTQALLAAIAEHGETLALVLVSGVQYYSGVAFDLAALTAAAHAHGALLGADLAHAIGNLPLQLHAWDVDFAVWCTYKYLNGGPGNVGGCFVHARHSLTDRPRLAGWWGHDPQTRFRMPSEFVPTPGADGWQLSNPPVLALAALRASLELFLAADMTRLRAKSEALTGYLEFLLQGLPLEQITPRDPAARGCQLSIRIPGATRALPDALHQQGLICDWREPDVLRLAPVPLYNTFDDVYRCVQALKEALV